MWTISIAALDRSTYFDVGSFNVERTLNGRSTFRGTLRDEYGGYQPSENQILILQQNGVTQFGGIITEVSTTPISGDVGRLSSLTAVDYNVYPAKVYIDNLVIPTGSHVIDVLNGLVDSYLSQFGVTLDTDNQQGGAELLGTIEWDLKTVEDALNEMAVQTGWIWRIDHNKKLWMYDPTTQTCPIAVSEDPGEACHPGVTVVRNSTNYANRIKLRIGSAAVVDKTSTWEADGFTRSWQTNYIPLEPLPGDATVWVGGVSHLLVMAEAHEFSWNAASRSIVQSSGYVVQPSGVTLSFAYGAQFPMTIEVEDPGGIASYGLTERMITVPDCYDYYSGVAIANGLLRKATEIQTEIAFTDSRSEFAPGQIVNVNLPNRGINEDFLITDVVIRAESQYALVFGVKCIAGSELSGNWLDKFRQWASMSGGGGSGGGFGGFGSIGGNEAPIGAWYLGGSRFHAVRAVAVAPS